MGESPAVDTTAPGKRLHGRVTEIVVSAGFDTTATSVPAPDSTLPQPGAHVEQYEIIRELGRGGMGAVFLARDTKLARLVAIKFLHRGGGELTERFIVEARATARCSHENIVVIHQVDEHNGHPFMVLEYLKGQPLAALLRHGPLAPQRTLEIIVPVVRALACAHALDIVHRDLKPENVFITDTGIIKVLDFGIAKILPQPSLAASRPELAFESAREGFSTINTLTNAGALVGTFPYMSPEQWGADDIDHRSDLWAVGILLFQMLTGRHPLAPLSRDRLMTIGALDEPMPLLRQALAELPPGTELPDALIDVVDRCLVKPKRDRIDSAQTLLAALEALLPSRYGRALDAGESPYLGLSAFQESDADRFFGRSNEIADVLTRLHSQPLVSVVGPSGVGKSSFIRAGVTPALKSTDTPWESFVLRPGRHPLAAIASMLLPLDSSAADSDRDHASAHDSLVERLRREPGYLGTALRYRARSSGRHILLFIDQLEELYTLVPDKETRTTFTACLAGVADDATTPLRVIVSIRSDFLDRVVEDSRFMTEMMASLVLLPPPDRSGLKAALTQPAEMVGYRFEDPDTVTHMLDALEDTPGALPLLQFAASKLWEARDRRERLLTAASYAHIGGITGALASHADTVLASLPSSEKVLARAVFQCLVTPERTRAIASIDELSALSSDPESVQRLIHHLVSARLLSVQVDDDSDGSAVEIVHESLIHSWPLLRRWLDEHEDDAAFLEQLRIIAKQWQARDQPVDLLWRGETLDEARRWHRRYSGPLTALQSDYLQAAFAQAERTVRLKRLAIAGVMSFLVLLVVAGSIALLRIRSAEKSAQEQATAARAAEKQVRSQLALVKAKERARALAEAKKQAAEEETERANQTIREKQAALADANAQLRAALATAQSAQAQAEQDSARARAALQETERAKARAEDESHRARQASAEARQARDEVRRMLERERDRAERLERKLGTFSSTLK